MNSKSPIPTRNPFTLFAAYNASAFYGRQREIDQIYSILSSETPFSCSIVGETYIGKTSLLRYLRDQNKGAIRQDTTFVNFDASPYSDLATGVYASVQFWWDMWQVLQRLAPHRRHQKSFPPVLDPKNLRVNLVATAHEYESKCEELLSDYRDKQQDKRVIIILDNFEGVASLPVRDSAWLRSLTRYCTYIASSRYPLELLYHPGSWGKSSPIWNVFYPQSIQPGLMAEKDVSEFISQRDTLRDFWREEDVLFIRAKAGRHPALLRMLCELFYRKREEVKRRKLEKEEIEFLEFSFYKEASIICNQLWHGLADPELMGVSRPPDYQSEAKTPSQHQTALLKVIQNGNVENVRLLLNLEQRGLVECIDGKWQVFAEVMHQFLLNLAQIQGWENFQPAQSTQAAQSQSASPDSTTPVSTGPQTDEELQAEEQSVKSATRPAFTYLEGEVYRYLLAHANKVCDKNDIKQAIWKEKQPTDSTLQKLIERIRRKIEPDPDNPHYLIAVRGQGYILRSDQPQGSSR